MKKSGKRQSGTKQELEAFGTYGFTFGQKLIRVLIRLGISRGKLREAIENLWWRAGDTSDTGDTGSIFDLTYHGLHLRLRPKGNTIERKILLSSKFRERKEIQAITHKLVDGVFVDIGANIGYYSLMIARLCPKAKIIAFEPNENLHRQFCANIEFNDFGKRIKALAVGVGHKRGSATLSLDPGDAGGGSLIQAASGKKRKSFTVKMTTLKAALEKLGIKKIHALKIDIEGYEDKALMPYFRSADDRNLPDIIIIEDNQTDIWEENIIQFLTDRGYRRTVKTRGNAVFSR